MNAITFVVVALLAVANAGLLAAPGAISVVRAEVPIAYSAVPTLTHAAPVAHAFSPLTFTGPAHIRIARGIVAGPSVLGAPLGYAHPALVHAAPVALSAPIAYHAPLVYTSAVKTVHGHFLA
ncbi:unnamed protein product [Allacma fusca]|uniref:Uncharacterized protein n=1 Tax=Allacma fusca TaxID=39272 RepID=A0A8J2KS22_9HEXA|nr:unnamed protein product [Allacma fusca]